MDNPNKRKVFHLFPNELVECLPNPILNAVSEYDGIKADFALAALIGAASAGLPHLTTIYGEEELAPNIYICIVAPAASGKGIIKRVNPILETYLDNPKWVDVIPGNISAAAIVESLDDAKYGGVIFETEADSVGNQLGKEWGDYSDVLRKCAHHETVRLKRKSTKDVKTEYKIDFPRLSIVLSGTEDQLGGLISNVKNGTFSRFSFLYSSERQPFKSQLGYVGVVRQGMEDFASKVMAELIQLQMDGLHWSFHISNDDLRAELDSYLEHNYDKFQHLHGPETEASSLRLGILMMRLMMILSIVRQHKDVGTMDMIEPTLEDFMSAKYISQTFLNHAALAAKAIQKPRLSKLELKILRSLENTFSSKSFIAVAQDVLQVKERQARYKLARFKELEVICSVGAGKYKKNIS